jgi:methanogenic corrinoid protein MtbC1
MAGLDEASGDTGCFEGGDIGGGLFSGGGKGVLRDPGKPLDDQARLAKTIERDIIPRLLLAHRSDVDRPATQPVQSLKLASTHVVQMCDLVLRDDVVGAEQLITHLSAGGVPLDVLLLELLSPAARRVGDLWLEDRISFTDVTMALCHLQYLLRSYGGGVTEDRVGGNRRILLSATPSEQHSFGILMVEEFFRRGGWDVNCLVAPAPNELIATARGRWYDAYGISVSCNEHLGEAQAVIAELRRRSRNPNLVVIVGGKCFLDRPELAQKVGADGTAVDGREAIGHTQRLVEVAAKSA